MKLLCAMLLFPFFMSLAMEVNKVTKIVTEKTETYQLYLSPPTDITIEAIYFLDGPCKGEKRCYKIEEIGNVANEKEIDNSMFDTLKDLYKRQQQAEKK